MQLRRGNPGLRRMSGAVSVLVFLVFLGACQVQASPSPEATPEAVRLDEICQEAVNTTFISEESIYLGETDNGSFYGPMIISFYDDGRVAWRYSIEPVFGTYTCTEGRFDAEFPEGTAVDRFSGDFDSVSKNLIIEGKKFLPATDT